jgi:flagellin
MTLSIASNTASSYASNAMHSPDVSFAKSLEWILTGKRIKIAKDHAAGLAIRPRLRTQSNGLRMATRNVNDGILALQIADGSAHQCVEQLQRIHELAAQASNFPLTSS